MSTREAESGSDSKPQSRNLASQGGVVASMTLLSRISGFLRDVVLSHFFGASGTADAFFVAFRIPNFFRRLFAEGAFAQAFVPVLNDYQTRKDRAQLVRFVQVMGGDLLLTLVLICALGVAGAPVLVMLFAPGFWQDGARLELATDMVYITFSYLGFISLTAFAGSILNSFHRYAVPAFTPVLLNLSLILAALVAAPLFDRPVMALAWGVVVAGGLQLLFQIPALKRVNMLVTPALDWRDKGVVRVAKLLLPAVVAASAGQINALIDTMIASLLMTGSISWLYYSDRLMELPLGLVAIALGTVLLPNLSRLHSEERGQAFGETLEWGLKMGILLGLPAVLGLYVLASPLIVSIFLHGEMTALDAAMSALSLKTYAPGLLGLMLVKITAPGYFSRQDTVTPLKIGLVAIGVNLIGNLALFHWMGHVGLALATSAAAIVNGYLLLRGLMQQKLYRPGRELAKWSGKVVLAGVVLVVVISWLVPPDADWLVMSSLSRISHLSVIIVSGATAYFVLLLVLGLRPSDLRHRV